MQNDQLHTLFERLGLGRPLVGPEKVTGGLLHRMWRVTTESGSYAIKQLNPQIMKRPNIEHIYTLSEKIASAFAEMGIPAIPAIMRQGSPLNKCGEDTVMVFAWNDGAPAKVGSIDHDRSYRIGAIMGALHSHRPNIEGLELPTFTSFSEEHWRDLMLQVHNNDTVSRSDFDKAISEIIALSDKYSHANESLRGELVISHRDMDQKNVLWTENNNPAIIDWEAAGPTNPAVELFDTALNWSGMAVDDEGLKSFEIFIKGYRSEADPPLTDADTAFIGIIGNWMEWLEFNLQRATDDSYDAEEKQLGEREVSSTMRTILSLHSRSRELIDRYETSLTVNE